MASSQQEIEEVRHALGYDRPWYVQYIIILRGMLKLDFGNSLRYKQPALQLVLERVPFTLILSLLALVIGSVLGLLLGMVSAIKRGTIWDNIAMTIAVIGQAVPAFWLAFMLILIFAVNLRILPSSGAGTWKHLILPLTTLTLIPLARVTRLSRASFVEVFCEDYIRTAIAKGANIKVVLFKHAIKNAIRPVATDMGMLLGRMITGAIITETVFALPGLGRLLVTSIQQRDFPLVQAAVFFVGFLFIFLNLVVDLLYPILDPRIRYM